MSSGGRQKPLDDRSTTVEEDAAYPPQEQQALVAEFAAADDPTTKERIQLSREKVRSALSIAVVSATGVVGVATIVVASADLSQAAVVQSVFTALVGLSGTVLGFYFSGKESGGT